MLLDIEAYIRERERIKRTHVVVIVSAVLLGATSCNSGRATTSSAADATTIVTNSTDTITPASSAATTSSLTSGSTEAVTSTSGAGPMPAVSLVFGEPIDLGIPAGCSQDGQCVSIGSGPSAVIVASQPSANQLVITGTRTDTVALDPAVASAHTTLQAVGPDDVVYLTVQASAQLDPVGQLVAVATTGPQRGRVIATSTDLVDLSGDTSLMPTESGLVPVNCCDDAIDIPASSSAALLGWVDQLGNPGATLEASVSLQREPAALTIVRSSALGRSTWRIDGVADFRGIPVNSPLGDGGVIVALNYERGPDGRAQSEIFRLTPDGFVATAKLDGIPIAFNVDGGVITVADERFKLVPTELPHA